MNELKTPTPVSSMRLLAESLWQEYQAAANDARCALCDGDKLKALTLAIWANKIKQEYLHVCDRLIFG